MSKGPSLCGQVIQKDLFEGYLNKLDLTISWIDILYKSSHKSYLYSELLPELLITATSFSRNRSTPLYFCDKDTLIESLVIHKTDRLTSIKDYFSNELQAILEDKNMDVEKRRNLLSNLFENLLMAIDDLRIWGITYARKTNAFEWGDEELKDRNICRMSMCCYGEEQ